MRFRTAPRSGAAIVGALIATVLIITGCSVGDTSATASGDVRNYTDASGAEVAIPARASRVVTLSELSLDGTLALGLQPVGTTSGRGLTEVPSYLADRTRGVPVVASVKEPDLEQILGLRPDLILVDNTTAARTAVDQLSKIAPTVLVATENVTWDAYFTTIADILGRGDEARQVTSEINGTIDAARARIAGRPGLTASVVRWSGGRPSALGGDARAYRILEQIGFARPASQRDNNAARSGEQLSLEQISAVDADYLFFGNLAGREAAGAALEEAKRLPNFADLGAVRSGHVTAVDGVAWTSAAGPLGMRVVLDDILTALGG